MSSADVLVYGPTAAGVLAAVAACRAGANAVLLGPEEHLGGMVSSGLSWTDFGRSEVVSGLTRYFYKLVAEHYGVPLFGVKGPEPHVAEAIFARLLEDCGAVVILGAGLETVEKAGNHIIALSADGVRHDAGVFIDASYEGDLMAGAGVAYTVGREPKGQYNESWAGRQPAYRPGRHNFPAVISPFSATVPGELLPEIVSPVVDERGWPIEALGEGDTAMQAYQLRLCMTDRRPNQLPLDEPDGYEPDRFEVLRRYFHVIGVEARAGGFLGIVPDLLPHGKCDVNSLGPFSLNLLDGSNRAYPGGDRGVRATIYQRHRKYSHELLYFLRTDPAVPSQVRAEVDRWSLCADEFTTTGGWPYLLYVREARRMVGALVMTEHDLLVPRPIRDVIAVGSYNIDIREVERTWRYIPEYEAEAGVFNEGYISLAISPFPIPYQCLLPREEDVDNLLVPVCCSASHIAYGSLRTEPTLMALGEAAGMAAAVAATRNNSPATVATAPLWELLRQ